MNDQSSAPVPLNYARRDAIVPRVPLGRRLTWIITLLCLVGTLWLIVFALVPRDTTARDAQGELRQVSILHSGLANMLPLFLLAGFVQLLSAGIVLLVRKRLLFGILLVLAAIFASFVALGMGIVHSLGPWTICDQITTADGTRYYFIDSSFLQGQTMAIARLKSNGPLYQTLEVLGSTNGDSPRSYLLVVRPVPIKNVGYGALYATPDGRQLVGLRYDNACYLVYDLSTKQFHGHGDVEKLSPFLLLDDKSQLYAPDEANIVKTFGNANDMGIPTRQSLTQALTHPNPAVRQSAAGMLKVMKP